MTYTGSAPDEYSTSIVGNRTVAFIRQAIAADPTKPFLAVAATRAPHGPETPAPWYQNALGHARNLRTPAWNYSAAGHVPWIADLPPLNAKEAGKFDAAYRNRCFLHNGNLVARNYLVVALKLTQLSVSQQVADTSVS